MKYSIRLLTILLSAASLAACTDIVPDGDIRNDGNLLSAVKVPQSLSRSVPPNTYFDENTQYRLWAYQNNAGANGEYLFSSEDGNGLIGTEASSHYVNMDSEENSKLRGDVNIYGFTEGTETAPIPDAESTVEKPTFTISYNGSTTPAAGTVENYIYPDYMRAMVNHNANSTMAYSTLEFRHIMSQISVQVIQQDKDGNQPTSRYDLRVKDIAVKGLYDEASYDVISDKLTVNTSGGEKTYPIWKSANAEGDAVGITSTELVRTIIMPTVNATKGKGITLELTIEGNDVGQFLDNNATSGKIDVPVYDNANENTPLEFMPNFRYILQVAFIGGEVRVVTLVPEVYPWFDGETSSTDGDEYYKDKDLGATALFDNLLWSTLNLGAEVSNPRISSDFEKSIGFFYQFDRNIPYFPETDDSGNLTVDINNAPSVYPIVVDKAGNIVSTNYPPTQGKGYIETLENLYEDLTNRSKTVAFGKDWSRPTKKLWGEIRNQPPPPGWRLPTAKDFLSIMPSTPHAGNITFLTNLKYKGPGTIGGVTNNVDTLKTDVIYIHVPNDPNYPSYPAGDAYRVIERQSYPNGTITADYVCNPESNDVIQNNYGDPEAGYKSEYVISKRNGARDFVGKPNKQVHPTKVDYRWGCIYGIKKVGTSEAYRMRWHIESIGNSNENKYVLVVSRYSAKATDRLLYSTDDINDPHYYMNYDWSHPNTVLYFPICGMVGSGTAYNSWRPGQVGNVGTETIFTTSEKASEVDFLTIPGGNGGDGYATLRIKIGGDGRRNQFIHLSIDPVANGAQIRCVRDYSLSTRNK